jgi:glycosyltransferase involved in cell wall biosynthesis
MKIIFSANSSRYLYNFRRNSIAALMQESHDIYCISPYDQFSEKLTSIGVNYIPIKLSRASINPFKEIQYILSIIKIFKKIRPDLIINFTVKSNLYGSIASIFLRKKPMIINNITGLGSIFIKRNIVSFLINLLYKLIKKRIYLTYFQNQYDLSYFLEKKLVDEERHELLPGSGVDCNHFIPISKASKHKTFRFIFVGRLIKDKGIMELIESSKRLSNEFNFELIILGIVDKDNPTSLSDQELFKISNYSFIKIFFDVLDIRQHLGSADCFVLPSYREGLPRSALEAMSCGLPIILSDAPGCKNLVSNNINGLTCNVRSVNSLYLAQKEMLSKDKQALTIMGKNGRSLVLEKYSETIVIKSLLDRIAKIKFIK